MKNKIGKVIGIGALCIFVVYLLVTGISDLTNKKDLVTVRVDGAVTILELKHSINYIIPTGTDYYYVGIEDETGKAYIINAPKKWLSKNFSDNHEAKDKDGVMVTGLVKRISSSKASISITNKLSSVEGLNLQHPDNYCIETNYKFKAIGKLALLFIPLVIGLCIYFVAFSKKAASDKISTATLVFIGVAGVIWLYLLLMVLR